MEDNQNNAMLFKFHSSLKTYSEILFEIAKISTAFSVTFGTIFIMSYLFRNSAPFPATDSYLLMFFNIFTLPFAFIILNLAVVFYSPALTKGFASKDLMEQHPTFFNKNEQPSFSGATYKLNFNFYAWSHLPFIFSCFVFLISIFISGSGNYTLVFLVGGFFLGIFMLFVISFFKNVLSLGASPALKDISSEIPSFFTS
jgi:hypothetical protein